MNSLEIQIEMLYSVAIALGDELIEKIAFVGGCTTGLLITDEFTREQVRGTDDVDLVVSVMTYCEYQELIQKLIHRGFKHPPLEEQDHPICTMKLDDLRVDIMPDEESILSFTNYWYSEAMKNTITMKIKKDCEIQLLSPPYFLATKFAAYNNRGNGDVLSSKDMEDIINLVDGRPELISEILESKTSLIKYLAEETAKLLQNNDLAYALQAQTRGDLDRTEIIIERLEKISKREA